MTNLGDYAQLACVTDTLNPLSNGLDDALWSVLILCRFCSYNLHVELTTWTRANSFFFGHCTSPGCIIILHLRWYSQSYWVVEGDVNRSAEHCDLLEISVPIRRAVPSLTISEGKLD